MQIKSVSIKEFRNLKDFKIDFSQSKTVLIGQNASGKSNFLEAIVLIFKQLDFFDNEIKKEHWFEYEIIYKIREHTIKISRKLENGKEKNEYKFCKSKDLLGNDVWKDIPKFNEKKDEYLPKYVFAYYSGLGNGNRLEEYFEEYQRKFAEDAMKIKDGRVPKPPRLFYAELIHSQLSLFSFFIDNQPLILKLLKDNLSIEDLQTVFLTIQEPNWSTLEKKKKDPKFFGSQGVVKDLLEYLHDNVAFAPFRDKIENKSRLWEKKGKKTLDVVYLYFNDFEKIRKFIRDKTWTSFDFFHILNTANVSKLITKEGIKIRVKKKYADRILFKDLSEGEQQLLTVLGLMRFTYTEEALFLLDEPDTHLNALWQWQYMKFIEIVLQDKDKDKDKSNVQVILASHSPLTMGSLEKENVRRFMQLNDKLIAVEPDVSPRGMGIIGILTEIFGIPTTLDIPTQQDLDARRELESRVYFGETLNQEDEQSLLKLNLKLDNLGYRLIYPDPLYQKFEMTFAKRKKEKGLGLPSTPEEVAELNKLAEDLLKELFDNENI